MLYDKMDYHLETVEECGLPEPHAAHHILFFLRWLIENDLMSEEFNTETDPLADYQAGRASLMDVFEWWDGCLHSDMLSEEGQMFANRYFNYKHGRYIRDLKRTLQGKLPSEYHIEFTDENYAKLKPLIDSEYQRWKRQEINLPDQRQAMNVIGEPKFDPDDKKPWWKFW